MNERRGPFSSTQLAEGVADAIRTMNVQALAALYADDIVVRHNFRAASQSKAENLALLAKFFGRCQEVSYTNIELHMTNFGYLQQHDLKMIFKDGRQASVAVCQVIHIRDSAIVRLDEYLDPAPLAALMAEPG